MYLCMYVYIHLFVCVLVCLCESMGKREENEARTLDKKRVETEGRGAKNSVEREQ